MAKITRRAKQSPSPTVPDTAVLDVDAQPFWMSKTLDEMTSVEWESLCDGCGRCCLNKIEDEDTNAIHLTKVACKLLDLRSCQCRDYPNRKTHVPDCIQIDPAQVRSLSWLPDSCGYRRVEERRGLDWWHPLVSGSADTVHEAGISLRGWAKSERNIKAENFMRYLIDDFPVSETSEHRPSHDKPLKK
jgi:uncharacterized protein